MSCVADLCAEAAKDRVANDLEFARTAMPALLVIAKNLMMLKDQTIDSCLSSGPCKTEHSSPISRHCNKVAGTRLLILALRVAVCEKDTHVLQLFLRRLLQAQSQQQFLYQSMVAFPLHPPRRHRER